MKNLRLLYLIISLSMLATGCSTSENKGTNTNQSNTTKDTGYAFDYNGVTIHMNDKADQVIESLGKPLEYFEAPSCAFQGLDKIYYYVGFNLSTYPGLDGDYISAIEFADDSVSTKEGITLGTTKDRVIASYGDNYTQDNGSLIYTKGSTRLTFLMEDDTVSSINYEYVAE